MLKTLKIIAIFTAIFPRLLSAELLPNNFYQTYDNILKYAVKSNGLVDYKSLANKKKELTKFLIQLAAIQENNFQQLPAFDQLALLINLYNASTLKLILDYYPLESIKNIPEAFELPFMDFLGKKISLNELENDFLRKNYHEPRIHFALVCAAFSCPPLRSEVYQGAKLSFQLNNQVRRFLSSKHHFNWNKTQNYLELSQILDWYGEDFINWPRRNHKSKKEAILFFISLYMSPNDQKLLRSNAIIIKYIPYNWALNQVN